MSADRVPDRVPDDEDRIHALVEEWQDEEGALGFGLGVDEQTQIEEGILGLVEAARAEVERLTRERDLALSFRNTATAVLSDALAFRDVYAARARELEGALDLWCLVRDDGSGYFLRAREVTDALLAPAPAEPAKSKCSTCDGVNASWVRCPECGAGGA